MFTEGAPKNKKLGLEQAQEEANMLRVEAGETPTAKDYEDALYQLEMLEKAANEGPVESMDKVLRAFVAGTSVAFNRIPKLLAAAVLNVAPYPKNFKERNRKLLGGGIIEQLKRIPKDYDERRSLFQTAREELEKWKAEAEGFAKRQDEKSEQK